MTRSTVVITVLALAVLAACGSPEPAETGQPPPPAGAPAQPAPGGEAPPTGEPAPGGAAPDAERRAQVGAAHRGALALVALGGLGAEQGASEQVRDLGGDLAAAGRALADPIAQRAAQQGLTLSDATSAEQQAQLADLQARSGERFDQAWLRAVSVAVQEARAAADAVLTAPDAAPATAATRDALARLGALAARVQEAASSSGAAAPSSVQAGSGGQAAEGPSVAPILLVAGGLVLLAGAAWLLRRRTG